MWPAGNAASALGFTLDRAALPTLTLAAARPGVGNVTLLADRHGADTGRVACTVLISTALAFLSFSTLAWNFGAGQAGLK